MIYLIRKLERLAVEKITHIVFDHDGTLVNMGILEQSLFPGMYELLEFLVEEKVKLYVWTARSKASTIESLKTHKVMHLFEDICGGTDAPGKPSADGIHYLLPQINPKNVVVIGDSLGDIIGGKKFGAQTIGAMWGHQDPTAGRIYTEYGANNSFLTVNEFKEFIENKI
jgi:phosphoglycolate phosphatase